MCQHFKICISVNLVNQYSLVTPNSQLCFQCSFPPGPVPQALQLGKPESHPMSPPATQEETMPFGAAEDPQSERNLHAPTEAIPKFRATPAEKSEADAQPQPLPQLCSGKAHLCRGPRVDSVVSAHFLDGCDMHRARNHSSPRGTVWSKSPPSAGHFSRVFCPNRYRFGRFEGGVVAARQPPRFQPSVALMVGDGLVAGACRCLPH